MSLEQLVKDWDPLFESLVHGQPFHRASIWGQIPQESNAKPDAQERSGSDKYGIGLWQHSFDRHTALVKFAEDRGKPWSDIETQVRFVAQELLTTRKHAWEQIQKTTSPDAAAATAMAYFEAPAGWEQEIQHPGTTTANLPRRIEGTYQALAVIQAAQPGAKPVTDTPIPTTQPAVIPSPTNDPTVNGLAEWIINNEVAAQQVIKGLLVAQGIPGFAVDLLFQIATPIFNQAVKNIHPDDIAKGLVAMVGHFVQNLQQHKTA